MIRHLSITRLRLRSWRFLPEFLYRTIASQRQVTRSDGFLEGYVARGPDLVFWTVTLWSTSEAMRGFRGSGAHRAALHKLALWCDEAATASIGADSLPDAAEASRMLRLSGHLFKVRHPSVAHKAGHLWPDDRVPLSGQRLMPVNRR